MKKVIVASLNPAKINAVKQAFEKVFTDEEYEFVGVSVPSGVPDQPMTDIETKQGAVNRVANAQMSIQDAAFWVGLEGGIEVIEDVMMAFAWMVVKHKNGQKGFSRTATFNLPPEIKKLVMSGMELGHADDIVFKKENSKQSNGAVGLLTNNILTRDSYYEHALILALIPFVNESHYL